MLPRGPSTGGEHSYCSLGAETFQVRGPTYLTDGRKAAAGASAFELMEVELFLCEVKIGNVAARRDGWLRAARAAGDTRYYLVVSYVTPASPFVHVIFYYAVNQAQLDAKPHLQSLWTRFTAHGEQGDAFRNDRWKVIPRIAEGSWIVSSAVGTKPALLAQKLTHTWILCDDILDPTPPVATVPTVEAGCGSGGRARGSSFITRTGPGPYLEADCDVASSSIAHMLVSLLQQYAKYIVIDLGFAIEPRTDDECPEVLLGTVRLSRMDVSAPRMVKVVPGDWVLGKVGVTHETEDE